MTDDDKPHFGHCLTHFGVVHQKPVSKDMLRAYWADLKEMSRMEFDTAVAHLKRVAQWMPKPAEFWASRRAGWM